MKTPAFAQSSSLPSTAYRFLLYGAFLLICQGIMLCLYQQLSLTPQYGLLPLTHHEQLTVLEHLWVSLGLLILGGFFLCRAEHGSDTQNGR